MGKRIEFKLVTVTDAMPFDEAAKKDAAKAALESIFELLAPHSRNLTTCVTAGKENTADLQEVAVRKILNCKILVANHMKL